MEFVLSWRNEHEDLRITTFGDARVEEFDEMLRGALDDPRFRPRMRILIDHRATRLWAFSNEEIRRRADHLEGVAERIGPQRIAFVVGSRVDLAPTRLFVELLSPRVPFELYVTESPAEARTWLSAAPSQSPRS